jgi:hypothetical protein
MRGFPTRSRCFAWAPGRAAGAKCVCHQGAAAKSQKFKNR